MIITEKMRYDLIYLLDMAKVNVIEKIEDEDRYWNQEEARENMSRILKLESFLRLEVKN